MLDYVRILLFIGLLPREPCSTPLSDSYTSLNSIATPDSLDVSGHKVIIVMGTRGI